MPKHLNSNIYKQKYSLVLKLKKVVLATFCLSTTILLSACQFSILEPKGPIAVDEKQLLLTSAFLMLVVILPVILLTLAFAWRYRASNHKAKYLPNWAHSTSLELVWWSIPCVIVVILGVLTWFSSYQLDPYKPLTVKNGKVLIIEAIALEWKWLFIYPEQNFATVNYIQIPVGVPVSFHITAEGPMNSLQIPQLGGQIYAMAGMQTKLHLIATVAGVYQGFSANFSGDGFSEMKFTVQATTEEEFANWVKTVKQAPEKLTMLTYQRLAEPGLSKEVKFYSSANKDLFETVVMKTMMPMPATTTKELAKR